MAGVYGMALGISRGEEEDLGDAASAGFGWRAVASGAAERFEALAGDRFTGGGRHHDDDDDDDDDYPPPCFLRGTLIDTPAGAVPVETLRVGHRVVSADGSILPVLWAGGRRLGRADLVAKPHLRPVVIKPGRMGNAGELRLSPQHAVAVRTPGGTGLVRATHLARRAEGCFRVAHGMKTVSYHHVLLTRHALLRVDGALVESMWPGPMALAAIGAVNRAELRRAAPELEPALNGDLPVENLYGPRAAPLLSGREAMALKRIEAPSCAAEVT